MPLRISATRPGSNQRRISDDDAWHMIALTKAVIVNDYSITALRATVATVGALIVAKAILVVENLPIDRFFSGRLVFNACGRHCSLAWWPCCSVS